MAVQNISHRDVHQDAALTNFSVGFHPGGFVAEMIAPVIPVVKESDKYYVWGRQAAFQKYDSLRADGSRAKVVDFGLSTSTYTAEEYALATKVTEREKDNADSVLRLRQSKTQLIIEKILLDQEARVAELFTTSGNYATGHVISPSVKWDASSGTIDILGDLDTATELVRKAIGKEPNKILMGAAVAKAIMRNSTILDMVRYTQPNLLVAGGLPPTIRGMQVIVAGATHTTSAEGATSVTYSDVWNDSVIVFYDPGTSSIDSPHFAKIFRARPFRVNTWVEEAEANSEYIEPSIIQDEVITNNNSGVFINNVLT